MIVHTYSETMTMYRIKLQGPTEWGRVLAVIEVYGSAGLEHGRKRLDESQRAVVESQDGEAS